MLIDGGTEAQWLLLEKGIDVKENRKTQLALKRIKKKHKNNKTKRKMQKITDEELISRLVDGLSWDKEEGVEALKERLIEYGIDPEDVLVRGMKLFNDFKAAH